MTPRRSPEPLPLSLPDLDRNGLPQPRIPEAASGEPAAQWGLSPSEVLLGLCVDDHHEVWIGRVRVEWEAPAPPSSDPQREGQAKEAWLPTLKGLVVRSGDRVLLTQPANASEPLVTGVVDALRRRREAPATPAAHRILRPDESLRIDLEDGTPLLEITPGETGPVVRLASGDLELAVDGHLGIRAGTLSLETHAGPVEIRSQEDVVVQGEIIRLN